MPGAMLHQYLKMLYRSDRTKYKNRVVIRGTQQRDQFIRVRLKVMKRSIRLGVSPTVVNQLIYINEES